MERTGIVQHLLPCTREARQAFKTIASQGGNRLLRFREREEAAVVCQYQSTSNPPQPWSERSRKIAFVEPAPRNEHRLLKQIVNDGLVVNQGT